MDDTEKKLVAIDLFSGSGAVTLGLKQSGFNVLAAIDVDPIAGATFTQNHPEVDLELSDIVDVDPRIDFSGLPEKIDLLTVRAPCQPFSNRNRLRSTSDKRVVLVLEAIKFVRHFNPKIVFFENVPGLERNPVFRNLFNQLYGLNYFVGKPKILDAAKLGVPQRRPRMILVAAKTEELLSKVSNFNCFPRKTVRETISDLPTPKIGRNEDISDPLHYSRRHMPITLERLKHIPKNGGSRCSLPEHLVLRCHKSLSENQYPDNYGRMAWDDIAPTLTTGCTDLTKGRYTHPEENRAITLREAARLQTFPDDYLFCGNASQIAMQIGNAVPPKMMKRIASRFAQLLN